MRPDPSSPDAAAVSNPPDLSADQALAGTPDPVPATVAAMTQLADLLGHASTGLYDYRRDNPTSPDLDRIVDLETTLDQRTIDLRSKAIRLLGAQAAQAVAQLQDATAQVDAFLADVKTIEARLALASSVIALAGAALVGDTGAIFTAVDNVHTALKAASA